MAAASIKDVAAAAGVSVGTVSNVLNRPYLVSEETQLRVHRAITDLGFVRNGAARQLRVGHSETVGYVVLDAANPFFTDVTRGAEDVATEEGIAIFLCNSQEDAAREGRYLELLLEQRVQGVLITPTDDDPLGLTTLQARGVPVVVVDRASDDSRFCSVSVDDLVGGGLAGQHLLDLGHRRIAFAGGPPRLRQVRERLQGLREVVRAADLPKGTVTVLETRALNVSEGRQVGERLLGIPKAKRPTAVFCANDLLALGLLQQLTRAGVNVPDEIGIVGYDDIEFAGAAAVPLTSVRQPREQLGRSAMELLLNEIREGAKHEHRQIRFEPELVYRESARPPRA